MIYCSLVTFSDIQKESGSGAKRVTDNSTITSKQPVLNSPGFDFNPAALQFAKEYIKKNEWSLEKVKKRSEPRFLVINSVFSKYGVPAELKYLAIVESDLNADTVCNSTGATGMWQLMPVTACELGLKITDTVDERLHVYKSSTAAAKYLRQLYAEFGDWLLVIDAYNSGPGKVDRAINLSGYRNFWQLQNFLPAETRSHVKRFVATLYFFEGQNKAAIQ